MTQFTLTIYLIHAASALRTDWFTVNQKFTVEVYSVLTIESVYIGMQEFKKNYSGSPNTQFNQICAIQFCNDLLSLECRNNHDVQI